MDPLTNLAEVLEFERIWWQTAESKDDAIRSKFGLSPVRYYQQLNQILDGDDALKDDPITVNRLRRIRAVSGPRVVYIPLVVSRSRGGGGYEAQQLCNHRHFDYWRNPFGGNAFRRMRGGSNSG